ncbi:MAG: hypothetical protein GY806_11015 [Gammaproteobacteria bacterium]|nr:hypothetical protein [Gammaproteobacteria bacterium]
MRNTHNHLIVLLVIFLSGALISPVSAQQNKPLLDKNRISLGAGISDNSVGRIDETGFQIFVGYDLNQINVMQGVKSSVEFGLIDFGFRRDSTGIWGTYVIEGGIDQGFGWLARAGLDIGDDNGLMFGAGIGYRIDQSKQFRIEYVVRDDVDSLQFNLIFH